MVVVSTHVQTHSGVIFAAVILDIYFWKTIQHVKVVSDLCSPNPCKNGGLCIAEDGAFSCACSGTGYVGPTCGKPVVYLEYILPIT